MLGMFRIIGNVFSKFSTDVAADYICAECGHRYITVGRADRTMCPGCDNDAQGKTEVDV